MSKLNATNQAPEEALEDEHAECRAAGQILDRIGDKWTVMAVGILAKGPMRFNAMMRAIGGVSHRMLTLTLRGLERDGLVKRTAYPTIPPKVEYELTELGRSLIRPLKALAAWAQSNRAAVEEARERFDGPTRSRPAGSSTWRHDNVVWRRVDGTVGARRQGDDDLQGPSTWPTCRRWARAADHVVGPSARLGKAPFRWLRMDPGASREWQLCGNEIRVVNVADGCAP